MFVCVLCQQSFWFQIKFCNWKEWWNDFSWCAVWMGYKRKYGCNFPLRSRVGRTLSGIHCWCHQWNTSWTLYVCSYFQSKLLLYILCVLRQKALNPVSNIRIHGFREITRRKQWSQIKFDHMYTNESNEEKVSLRLTRAYSLLLLGPAGNLFNTCPILRFTDVAILSPNT